MLGFAEAIFKIAFPAHEVHDWNVLESLPNCTEQQRHTDYNRQVVEDAVRVHGPQCCPFGAILSFTDGMILPVWRSSASEKEVLRLNRGDMIIFKAITIHAGGAYPEGHFGRLHAYLDHECVHRLDNTTDRVDK